MDIEKWIEENSVSVSYGRDSTMRDVSGMAVPEYRLRALLKDHAIVLNSDASDGARYRFIEQFIEVDDVGDDEFVLGIYVRSEDLEAAVGGLPHTIYRKTKKYPTVRDSIDAAMIAASEVWNE